jgi:hypothetical protein
MRIVALAVALSVVSGCGTESQVGQCGSAGEECCFFADGTRGCKVPSILPSPDALTCQSFTNGAYYCLKCGHDGEACCFSTNGDACEAGLVCSGPYPGSVSGGFCKQK